MLGSQEYKRLLLAFPPRPIESESQLLETQEILDSILDKPNLSDEEKEYINLLGTLIYEYESREEIVPDIYGIELLQALIDEFGIKQRDLVSIFKTESIVSAILKGKRQLTARHIEELARFFKISPAAFFKNVDNR
ncbi:helix-turn-helix domain-containing protein [Baaleninema simplex]|uniref:helix-turn-helix domain-containing protein n=1 Tax=Baaleninema simplex TaxID=2862350 RepID=UPI00037D9356|nr:transcriptional regulator [Baaleninema simplex]